MKKNRIMLC